jgi:hypothetical protein
MRRTELRQGVAEPNPLKAAGSLGLANEPSAAGNGGWEKREASDPARSAKEPPLELLVTMDGSTS